MRGWTARSMSKEMMFSFHTLKTGLSEKYMYIIQNWTRSCEMF